MMIKFLFCLTTLVASTAGYCAAKAERSVEIIMRPDPVVEVELGERVSLVCAAHGHNGMDPLVYWVKGIGPDLTEKGKRMGPTAVGKSTLFIESTEKEDIDSYKCVVQDCCTNTEIEITVEIVVPEDTCEDVYGVGHVVFGSVWTFRNWTAAVADCQAKGMELALPKNAEENAQLQKDLEASFNTHPNAIKFAHTNWCWLGATDEEEEGVWLSSKEGELLSYYNWDRRQPDNKQAPDITYPDTQNVAGIHRGTGRWDDSFHHYKRPYACLCPTEPTSEYLTVPIGQ